MREELVMEGAPNIEEPPKGEETKAVEETKKVVKFVKVDAPTSDAEQTKN